MVLRGIQQYCEKGRNYILEFLAMNTITLTFSRTSIINKPRLCLYLILASTSYLANASARPCLEFEATTIVVKAGERPLDSSVVRYRFTNVGSVPISILGGDVGCGCVSFRYFPTVVGAGQSGIVQLNIAVGERKGRIVEAVLLRTDEVDVKPYTLTAVLEDVNKTSVLPRVVKWKIDGEAVSKQINVIFPATHKMDLKGIEWHEITQQNNFKVTVHPGIAPNLFTVEVTPISTLNRVARQIIVCSMNDAIKLPTIYAIVSR